MLNTSAQQALGGCIFQSVFADTRYLWGQQHCFQWPHRVWNIAAHLFRTVWKVLWIYDVRHF